MRNVAAWSLWFLAGTVLASAAARGQEEPSYVIQAPALTAAPKLDGRIEEEEWREAVLLDGGFTQSEPEPGAPSTERTVVRIGYDERRLYVAVRCFDAEPEKVVAVVMDRDADLSADDSVQVLLDSFHDKNNAFLFQTNALGALSDALVRDQGDEINFSWDGIWAAAASRDDEGWSAELAIPFRTLRFSKEPEQTWGINIGRTVVRKFEFTSWKPVSRNQGGGTSLYQVSQAGELTGLRGLKQGRGFDVKPYLLTRAEDNDITGDDASVDVGIEVRKNLTSNLVLDLTYNLDFAEAEADEQQVNITRFPLFFPEKREFFLEGASLFYFGERPDPLKPPEKTFFFSRRVGLSGDGLEAIPVLGGAKISGKVGRTGVGFLNLTTEDHRYLDAVGRERFEPETNFTVLRLKQDVFKKSSIGFMGLNKAVSGGDDNRGAGVDWNFALGKYFKTGGFLADTSTPGLEGSTWAGMIDLVWEDPKRFSKFSYAEVGEEFNPAMGFYTRRGIRETRGVYLHHFTPTKHGLRDVYVYNDFFNITDRDGNVQSRKYQAGADILWPTLWGFALKFFDRVEAIDFPFEISPGIVIPPGRYEFANYFIGWQSSPTKPVFGFTQLSFGEFWDGDFVQGLVGAIWRPTTGVNTKFTWQRTDVELPAGEFTVDLAAASVVYSFNPRVTLRGLVQWRSDDNFDLKMVFRWTYKPGAALYVVYDEFRNLSDAVDFEDRSLLTKVSFHL